MKASHVDYAIALADDLERDGQRYSAAIVRRILVERIDAVNALRHLLAKSQEDWRPDWQEQYSLAERAIVEAESSLVAGG